MFLFFLIITNALINITYRIPLPLLEMRDVEFKVLQCITSKNKITEGECMMPVLHRRYTRSQISTYQASKA